MIGELEYCELLFSFFSVKPCKHGNIEKKYDSCKQNVIKYVRWNVIPVGKQIDEINQGERGAKVNSQPLAQVSFLNLMQKFFYKKHQRSFRN